MSTLDVNAAFDGAQAAAVCGSLSLSAAVRGAMPPSPSPRSNR